MSSIEISFAHESDLEAVFELLKYMYKIDQASSIRSEEWDDRTKSFLRAGFEDDKVGIFVARDTTTSEIIGCGVAYIVKDLPKFYLVGDSYGYVRWMAVDKDWRNKGIGQDILKKLLEFFNSQGVVTIQVHAADRAKAFYERFGFSAPDNENLWLVMDES